MTPGRLRKVWPDRAVEATCGPEGWESADADLAASLNALYPVGGSAAGFPWVRAFHAAAAGLGARVLAEPMPDSAPGRIH
jgi:hypothetical protein